MDEVELMRRLAPAVPAPSDTRKNEARLALAAAVAASSADRRWSLRRPRRSLGLAFGVALLAIILARGPVPLVTMTDPAAVTALQHAAAVAATRLPVAIIGDGFVYQKTDALWAVGSAKFTYLRPLTREFWMAADGSGRIRETVEEPIFLSESERQVFMDGGYEVLAVNEDIGPRELQPLLGWESLPNDADQLRELVRGLAEGSDQRPIERGMFTYIGDLLRDPLTQPDVRAGLFKVAATLPGIQLRGEMRDELGRAGLGVSMTHWFEETILIFDPETSELLEERTVRHLPHGDTWPPIVWSRSTYVESGIVPQLPGE